MREVRINGLKYIRKFKNDDTFGGVENTSSIHQTEIDQPAVERLAQTTGPEKRRSKRIQTKRDEIEPIKPEAQRSKRAEENKTERDQFDYSRINIQAILDIPQTNKK